MSQQEVSDIIFFIFMLALTIFIGFVIGAYCFTPDYDLSDEIKDKFKSDAKVNYRTEEKHIGYILNKYYKEVKTDGNSD